MPLQRIGSFLGASEELKTLSARTRRLQALQKLYLRSAPRDLAGSSRVKSYRAGTLIVTADNPAVAAKLKQLSPTLLASIRETEAEVTVLRIEVQVSGAARSGTRPPRKVPLSIDAVEKFEELSESIEDGDLKSALTRLVKHHLRHK